MLNILTELIKKIIYSLRNISVKLENKLTKRKGGDDILTSGEKWKITIRNRSQNRRNDHVSIKTELYFNNEER